ncbi:MAG: restriction endonuclease [Nanoarchaeota archaeon]|nr:restriction endonuclease [Nanoarchaeota archaeon]
MSYETGKKFEIYVEQLFKDCGFDHVERNLLYIKYGWFRKRQMAQIDIQVGTKGIISVPIIYELKYSSNGNISLSENPVDQLLRAAKITGYNPGGIITNKGFTEGLANYAKSKRIKLYDATYLAKLEKKRKSLDGHGLICLPFMGKDLEQRIEILENTIGNVNINEYKSKARTIYL